MKTHFFTKGIFVLLLFGSIISCRQKPADSSVVQSGKYRKSLKEAYQKVGLFCTSNFIPGVTVAVSIDNQLVWADGFGYSNYELKVKASPAHKFRIGQLTELITALTAAKLQEEGKLRLDKPVAEYLPEMTKKPIDFTIRQLGAHTAGIRAENVPAGKGNTYTIESVARSFMDDDLVFEPGSYYLHTELGFDLIGYILEKTSQIDYAKLVRETVLDTLKLDKTTPDSPNRIADSKSSTYDYDFIAQPIVAGPIDLRGKEASAGYLSSVLDLVKIGNVILYPGFLKQETIQTLTTPYVVKEGQASLYGFGLIVSKDTKDRIFYGQRGSVPGGSATLLIYPDVKMVIAMTANIPNNTWDFPVFDLAEIFRNQLHPEQKEKP